VLAVSFVEIKKFSLLLQPHPIIVCIVFDGFCDRISIMEDSREKLIKLCLGSLEAKGLNNEKFRNRLKLEIKEIDNQAEHDYFIDLYNKKIKFVKNENNLLVPYILGLTDEFDIGQDPVCVQGEFPDIDVDYLPIVQEYLRKEWCPKKFGRDNVVNIGNYATFGIKSALLDMARVHGADYQEIQSITKNLQDRDEEGNPITWEKALEITPELNEYCKINPEIADAAQRLIDRNRGRGKHAGGTVISNIKIADLVPIMTDTDGNPVSGWTEGLHDQDLQPVGLIKFDVLAVKDLLRIANCCHYIKQRHSEVKSIAANPGCSDWTDTSYLNDPLALDLANRAETRGIFQFDGEGMRNLIRAGGVTSFDDLVAYSALFRPSALKMKMHERYIQRKRGKEDWEDEIPSCIRDILSKTYGVLCYQEQVMQVLNIVGDIPLIHCEKIRKAISKKKTSEFIKYKQMFLENGSKKTGWPIDSEDNRNMNFLFNQIEAFSGYGFNKSHAVAYTYTSSRLLYLKAHYPLEFFCSTLSSESDEDKIKLYKREAERNGIKINRCDLNKSKVNYQIIDEEIYVGFSNIKGIGEEVAEKIVAGQPYSGLADFLTRIGTDKRIVEPLINLGVFKDTAPNVLLEFYEDFKKWTKSYQDKEKRQNKRRQELLDLLSSMLVEDCDKSILQHELIMNCYKEQSASKIKSFISKKFNENDVFAIVKKYGKSALDFEHKLNFDKNNSISFENWNPSNKYPIEKWPSIFELERKHYGFSWEHPIQKSSDYLGGHSFNIFKEDDAIITAGVEVMIIKKPQQKISKKENKYYFVLVEDEDWNVEVVTFWSEDYLRFKEELEFWNEEQGRGNFLKIRVTKPGSGFKSYTFESPPKAIRHKIIPPDKKDDLRLQIMESPM
jgi:DNA polymerase III alpha subunit